ncbi:hypothetical protein B0H12DRAFT_1244022 [Mycena haematopus]|nr:hypothetical protein B0H12DRAFT_1244022 [Mycena haematopus]
MSTTLIFGTQLHDVYADRPRLTRRTSAHVRYRRRHLAHALLPPTHARTLVLASAYALIPFDIFIFHVWSQCFFFYGSAAVAVLAPLKKLQSCLKSAMTVIAKLPHPVGYTYLGRTGRFHGHLISPASDCAAKSRATRSHPHLSRSSHPARTPTPQLALLPLFPADSACLPHPRAAPRAARASSQPHVAGPLY